jgi:hypothetical protein
VNGTLTGNKTDMSLPPIVTRTRNTIGALLSNTPNIAIDEVKRYNRSLSAEEVLVDSTLIGPIV